MDYKMEPTYSTRAFFPQSPQKHKSIDNGGVFTFAVLSPF